MQETNYLARSISALFSVFILISCTSKLINKPEKVGELSTKAEIEAGLPDVTATLKPQIFAAEFNPKASLF